VTRRGTRETHWDACAWPQTTASSSADCTTRPWTRGNSRCTSKRTRHFQGSTRYQRYLVVPGVRVTSAAAPHACFVHLIRLDSKPELPLIALSQASDPSFDSTLDSESSLRFGLKNWTSAGWPSPKKHIGRSRLLCGRIHGAHLDIVAYGGDCHHFIALLRLERVGTCSEDPHTRQEDRCSSAVSFQKCPESVGNHGRHQEETVQEPQRYATPPSSIIARTICCEMARPW
jgi:hypothetical protein